MTNKINTLLIVDDDREDKEFFQETLQEVDDSIQCLEADNGAEALELLLQPDTTRPDLIFLDLNMPRMDGWEFLSAIKKIEALCLIPVIIFSTSKRPEDSEKTKRLGADHFIVKPTTSDLLKHSLRHVLQQDWRPRC